MSEPITVVIADDHPIWVSGLKADLGDGFEVVGSAADAAEAIERIDELEPDVCLCDLQMPAGGGLRVAQQRGDATNVVILTVSEAERDVLDAVAAGALGYLTKSTGSDDLRAALRRAADGEPVFSPSLASLVLVEFRRLKKSDAPTGGLTEREREVLQYVARGLTYREIGEELFISAKTVENHTRNILDKLRLTKKQELMRYALEHGIE
ncbi:MAG: response regulator transcription factor [Actinomycetota bacterium]